MIVDCGVYRAGDRIASVTRLEDAVEALRRSPDAFCWIELRQPDEAEVDALAHSFDLPRFAVNDALRTHQRPRLATYAGVLSLVLKTLHWSEDSQSVRVGQTTVIMASRLVVSVVHGPGVDIAQVRTDLERRTELLRHGPAAVLYAISGAAVDGYATVADELDAGVDDVEQSVFSPRRTRDAGAIYNLKRQLVRFRRAVRPLSGAMERLAGGVVETVPPDTSPFFRDVTDRVLRLTEEIDGLDDLLTSVLSAHLAEVGVQQNDDMRRISAWVAIAAVPTVLAGIEGMNFDHMPELHWTFGYPVVLILMAVICGLLYRAFRRAGWL
jgi:magnesium transporter